MLHGTFIHKQIDAMGEPYYREYFLDIPAQRKKARKILDNADDEFIPETAGERIKKIFKWIAVAVKTCWQLLGSILAVVWSGVKYILFIDDVP